MKKVTAEFVGSFTHLSQLPKKRLPEVAFAGRSNVGKSSLINTLLGRKQLARTSGTPGKTRQLNYILVNDQFYFVDLPGYGFAKVSRTEREKWSKLIESYVSQNEFLKAVVSIIDIRHGPTESDLELLKWLAHIEVNTLVVATKADKLSRNQVKQAEQRITQMIETLPVHGPVFFSSQTGVGKRELWQAIEIFLE